MRILLIDDDADIRLLAGFVLEQAGHDVRFADSGAGGIELAAAEPYDLVLLDYRLGDMLGDDALAAILRQRPDARVVFLTGADDALTVSRLAASGAAGVIAKPFDPESLPRLVSDAADGPGTGSDGTPAA